MTDPATEAVAQAICQVQGGKPDLVANGVPWWKVYEKEAEAALAAAKPFLVPEWLPIETIPVDGTPSVICGLSHGEGPDRWMDIVHFDMGFWWDSINHIRDLRYADLWQPAPALPAPPSALD